MIGKSGSGGGFRGLANYMENKEKIEWKEVRNLPGKNRNQDIRLMEETASLSNRAEKPVYHLSVSYSPKDNPSKEMIIEDVDKTLQKLGLSDHQAVIVAHGDEEYKHVHIMANRIHQDKSRAWSMWNDRDRYRPIFREIEKDRGYEIVSDRNWAKGKNLTNAEIQQLEERGFGKMPLKAKAAYYDFDKGFEQAQSWKDIDHFLAKYDCHVHPKRGGGVIEHNKTGEQLKLSRVGRKFSFNRLEKEHGSFKEYSRQKSRDLKIDQTINKTFDRLPDKAIKNQFKRLTKAIKQPHQGQSEASEALKKSLNNSVHSARTAKRMVKAFSKLSNLGGPVGHAANIGKSLSKGIQKTLSQDRGRGLGR